MDCEMAVNRFLSVFVDNWGDENDLWEQKCIPLSIVLHVAMNSNNLEFTREVLLRLEAGAVESIEMWYDFYKNGFVRPE